MHARTLEPSALLPCLQSYMEEFAGHDDVQMVIITHPFMEAVGQQPAGPEGHAWTHGSCAAGQPRVV